MWLFFLCSDFFTLSQVTVTTSTPHVTVVCTNVLTKTMTVTIAPTSMRLVAASEPNKYNEGFFGFATVPQHQPQFQMPSQIIPIMPWILLR